MFPTYANPKLIAAFQCKQSAQEICKFDVKNYRNKMLTLEPHIDSKLFPIHRNFAYSSTSRVCKSLR